MDRMDVRIHERSKVSDCWLTGEPACLVIDETRGSACLSEKPIGTLSSI